MSAAVWHDLGPVADTCVVCSSGGSLTLGEARLHRTLGERLRRVQDRAPVRVLRCTACGSRWNVPSQGPVAD